MRYGMSREPLGDHMFKSIHRDVDRQFRGLERMVKKVNDLSTRFEAMPDDALRSMTAWFKERHERGETLDELLPEAFSAVREASRRALGLRHFDAQVVGGIVLHLGMIAEMRSGEGKTLVATLPGYLNAIPGRGVHVVTINDYLARRDAKMVSLIYDRLGMDVGLLQGGMSPERRKAAYRTDITYGTSNEFGFDYLRDNMITLPEQRVQRGHAVAIVDEADTILIDEAMTPLTISGAGGNVTVEYERFARAVRGLVADVDFKVDEERRSIEATKVGLRKIEKRLGAGDLYSDPYGRLLNHLRQALRAQYLFHRDQQYVVEGDEVKIAGELADRTMEGRRYPGGLHQAIEAKEGVPVRKENQTLATITLQNYFRLYDRLSGMAGTAMTEDGELREVYGLPVQPITPNEPVIRVDHDDLVYRSVDAKLNAVADTVAERHANGQPVLIGTVSGEDSERLSRLLDMRGVRHKVLSSTDPEREAHIMAQAGRKGAVTIATDMAGRGTDILLGGNPTELARGMLRKKGYLDADKGTEEARESSDEVIAKAEGIYKTKREHVLKAGGLCVIGTERHESRRLDSQLRDCAGLWGDPGETQFYLSLEDDLMCLFGGERMDRIAAAMERSRLPESMPVQSRKVMRAVEDAQRKVEEVNFSMRKSILDYDDVIDGQRRAIYAERNKVLTDGVGDVDDVIGDVISDVVGYRIPEFFSKDVSSSEWDLEGLRGWVAGLTGRANALWIGDGSSRDKVVGRIEGFISRCYGERSERLPDGTMRALSAQVMLRIIDARWTVYLQEMDYLRALVSQRGYGSGDPLLEYERESNVAFAELINTMHEDFLRIILRVGFTSSAQTRQLESENDGALRGARYSGPTDAGGNRGVGKATARLAPKRGRAGETGASGSDLASGAASAAREAGASGPYGGTAPGEARPRGGKMPRDYQGRRTARAPMGK